MVGTTATGDRVKGSFTSIKVVERDGAGLLGQLSTLLNQILGALNPGV